MTIIDLILHLDQHLVFLIQNYGTQIYLIMFLIIFSETGLVVAPFLPGDSLLFALGSVISFDPNKSIQIHEMAGVLILAAILGNISNYWIGHSVGPKIFNKPQSKFFKPSNLEETQNFYNKYGPLAIIFARFAPIIRTFVPFVAGIGRMNFLKYFLYTVVGGVAWVASFLYAGFYFGNRPEIKSNFHFLIIGILIVSVLPAIIGWYKMQRQRKV